MFIKNEEIQGQKCPYCDSLNIEIILGDVIHNDKLCNIWQCNDCNMTFDEVDEID